jgi:hemerythrin
MDQEARRFREGGDAARLSSYLFEVVPAWFVQHIRTMDHVTARFVVGARPGAAAPA